MSMILIKIISAWHRSVDWYRDVLPDVPLTVFRMNNTIFQRACFGTDEPKNRGTFLRFPDMPTAQLTWWCPDNYRPPETPWTEPASQTRGAKPPPADDT